MAELTKKQLEIVDAVELGDENLTIFGFAGTGKSFTLGEISRRNPHYVFVTPTNKAALALRNKGVPFVETVHSLLYTPSTSKMTDAETQNLKALKLELETEKDEAIRRSLVKDINDIYERASKISFFPKQEDLRAIFKNKTLIIDEASMIGDRVGSDIAAIGCRIVAVGDPAQLPPVKDQPYFVRGDFLLDEVLRQKGDSEVLDLATEIRKVGFDKKTQGYEKISRFSPTEKTSLKYLVLSMNETDQTICYTNKTKDILNRSYRLAWGRPEKTPVAGDRIVLTKTVRLKSKNMLLPNSEQYTVLECSDLGREFLMVLQSGSGKTTTQEVSKQDLVPGWPKEDPTDPKRFRILTADYAYAITCHKAQGSEWDSVTVILEPSVQDWRWLYTAVTRAKNNLNLLRK